MKEYPAPDRPGLYFARRKDRDSRFWWIVSVRGEPPFMTVLNWDWTCGNVNNLFISDIEWGPRIEEPTE